MAKGSKKKKQFQKKEKNTKENKKKEETEASQDYGFREKAKEKSRGQKYTSKGK